MGLVYLNTKFKLKQSAKLVINIEIGSVLEANVVNDFAQYQMFWNWPVASGIERGILIISL